MPRYMDADEMIKNLTAMKKMYDAIDLDGMIKGIEENVAPDVVQVVRCKDCKYCYKSGIILGYKCERWGMYHEDCQTELDGYCYQGERRDT